MCNWGTIHSIYVPHFLRLFSKCLHSFAFPHIYTILSQCLLYLTFILKLHATKHKLWTAMCYIHWKSYPCMFSGMVWPTPYSMEEGTGTINKLWHFQLETIYTDIKNKMASRRHFSFLASGRNIYKRKKVPEINLGNCVLWSMKWTECIATYSCYADCQRVYKMTDVVFHVHISLRWRSNNICTKGNQAKLANTIQH